MSARAAGAVVQAGLLDAANAVAPQKTIFAPNNAAFDAVAGVVGTLTPAQVHIPTALGSQH
jgi:hypothetical protein